MLKVKKAIITAAGYGSRFLPIVKSVPKEMLPIINKPIIQLVVEECINAGIKEIIIVTRPGNTVIKNYFNKDEPEMKKLLLEQGRSERYACVDDVLAMTNITIIEQDKNLPYGNGSPVISAKPLLNKNEPFAVLFADDLILSKSKQSGLAQLLNFYYHEKCDALMGVQKVAKSELNKYGIINPYKENKKQDSGRLKTIIEKPDANMAPSKFAQYGRFILPYSIFDFLVPSAKGKDNELWLTDANAKLANKCDFRYKQINGKWFTTGDPNSYIEAFLQFMLAEQFYQSNLQNIIKKLI